jgi:hypothetical protein
MSQGFRDQANPFNPLAFPPQARRPAPSRCGYFPAFFSLSATALFPGAGLGFPLQEIGPEPHRLPLAAGFRGCPLAPFSCASLFAILHRVPRLQGPCRYGRFRPHPAIGMVRRRSSVVEHVIGNDGVGSSILPDGTTLRLPLNLTVEQVGGVAQHDREDRPEQPFRGEARESRANQNAGDRAA